MSATDPGDFTRTAPPRPISSEAGPVGMLGGYRLLGVLGEGGMGIVYRAEDPQLGRPVAIKVMRPEAATPAARSRFLREARAMAALQHDHVAPVWHVGEDAGTPYLVMPLLEGETLAARIAREGRFAVAEAMRIARQMADGLAAAHEKGLVHRDVKPANVWLESRGRSREQGSGVRDQGEEKKGKREEGKTGGASPLPSSPNPCPLPLDPCSRVRLLDFGLARAAVPDAADALTATGSFMGTPAYMAPEQARGEGDHRADLFSLGCVLYEMLTGRKPFTGRDLMAIITSVAVDEPDDPATIAPELPADLVGLVRSLLAKNPDDRPSSAVEVVARLTTPTGPAPIPGHRSPVFGLAALAAVLLVAVGGAAAWWATRPPVEPVAVAPTDAEAPSATKPDEPPRGGPVVLKGHTDRVTALAWSPDSKRLASGGDDGRLCVWDVEAGTLAFRQEGLSDEVASVAWSPDGNIVAAGEGHDGAERAPISLWNAATGAAVRRFPGHPGRNVSLAFTAEGGRIVAGCSAGPSMRVFAVENGKEIASAPKQPAPAVALAVRFDNQYTAVSEARILHVVETRNGKPTRKLLMPAVVRSATFGGEGHGLAVCDDGGNVRVWDRGDEKPRFEAECRSPARSLAWSADGRVLSVAGVDRVTDFSLAGKLLRETTYDPPPGPADEAAVLSGGRRVAVSCRDGAVRVYKIGE